MILQRRMAIRKLPKIVCEGIKPKFSRYGSVRDDKK